MYRINKDIRSDSHEELILVKGLIATGCKLHEAVQPAFRSIAQSGAIRSQILASLAVHVPEKR